MGNGLSKEQEQCFRLLQQLFKAAGCLPDKGSLDLKIRGKQGREALIIRKVETKTEGSYGMVVAGVTLDACWTSPIDHPSCGRCHCRAQQAQQGRWLAYAHSGAGPDLSTTGGWM